MSITGAQPTMTDTTKMAQGKITYKQLLHAKAVGKPVAYRLGDGLFCWVTPSGVKSWRCKYQPQGGAQTMKVLGYFPEMSIEQAKLARAAIREQVRKGNDPGTEQRAVVAARRGASDDSFQAVAEKWMKSAAAKTGWTQNYDKALRSQLMRYVYPRFGNTLVAKITMSDVHSLIHKLHKDHPAVAVQVKQHLGRILDFALRWNPALPFNPARRVAPDLPSRASGKPEENRKGVRTLEAAQAVLRAVETCPDTSPYMLLAHRFLALTGVRKDECLLARWEEIDTQAALWTVPAERMKGKAGKRHIHLVPLSPQALEVIRAAWRLKRSELVFPSFYNSRVRVARGTLNKLMDRACDLAGLERVHPHGWRSTLSTIMNEANMHDFRAIDLMLAHRTFGMVEGKYNHAAYLPERQRIACAWADMLLEGAPTALALTGLEPVELEPAATSSNVVQLPRRAA
jgi:integrase